MLGCRKRRTKEKIQRVFIPHDTEKKVSTDSKHEVQILTIKLKLNRQKLKYTDQTIIFNKTQVKKPICNQRVDRN